MKKATPEDVARGLNIPLETAQKIVGMIKHRSAQLRRREQAPKPYEFLRGLAAILSGNVEFLDEGDPEGNEPYSDTRAMYVRRWEPGEKPYSSSEDAEQRSIYRMTVLYDEQEEKFFFISPMEWVRRYDGPLALPYYWPEELRKAKSLWG